MTTEHDTAKTPVAIDDENAPELGEDDEVTNVFVRVPAFAGGSMTVRKSIVLRSGGAAGFAGRGARW